MDRLLEEEQAQHRSRLEAALEGYRISEPRDHIHLRKGNAELLVPEVASETGADLIVMGTVGRTGISGYFIGNTAEAILGQIDCSVLAVKPPGFQTPVRLDE